MNSTTIIEQELDSDNFESSIERGKHLMATFNAEAQLYACQCMSCYKSNLYGALLPRFCIAGVVCPILWLCNITLCIYLRWWLPADPTHSPIALEQLPTHYELDAAERRAQFELDPFTLQDIRITNESITKTESIDSKNSSPDPNQDFCQDSLQSARYLFIKYIAKQVIDSHRRQRAYLTKWLLLSTAALGACILILATILSTTLKRT
ncbi:ASG7 (YJL170C) [Zygosaccharomyces parabailii]|uniref:ZYBA0S06-05864g1_1 n=1 Tax=Zygosaccharomyces bailii (strain CLIB 213 / ATCC 58445 / CBS 680 / BCRC 21525 / NBRC 1098 / NCYC 1416 / NRRL Y-2227) TaxID=1333698 RepID=A0A8J2XBQ6_ZYGB2|nr:ASG7 (YJL170C) [Zygosaccharomyces parabailii]CDF90322.1 ZYBA0S06-05864g1_1 [Zygosaccharomyces bailii CLIB 213]CDH11454.1 uncharacterized protein ZBAI_03240 [Zygosaccharomyces bailii ISA1307]